MTGRSRLAIDANRRLRHAVEIRHESFVSDDFISLLKKHGIGLVVADTAGKWPRMFEVTADFVYVRLHGDKVICTSGYTRRALGPRARASGEDERWKFNRRARPGGNRPPSRTRTGGIPARR